MLDTNSILRVILKDNIEMADIVENVLLEQFCFIPVEVIAELVYILTKVYKINRILVATNLKEFFEISNVNVFNEKIVNAALILFAASNLDFVDCLLVSYSKIENYNVLTFDKELKKFLEQ